MSIILTLALLAQAPTPIDLEFPQEAEGLNSVAFAPQGGTAYLCHSRPGTLTRFEFPGATPAGAITGSVEFGGSGGDVAISPDGATIYALDVSDGRLHSIDTATMTVNASANLDLEQVSRIEVDPTGTRGIVFSIVQSSPVKIIDLASLAIEREIDFPVQSSPMGSGFLLPAPVFLSDDGFTLTGYSKANSISSLLAFDIRTGAMTASMPVVPTASDVAFLFPSGDRSTILTTYFTAATGVGWARFDASTLQRLNDFTFPVGFEPTGPLQLNEDGQRALGVIAGTLTEFPITGTAYDPADPATTRFGGTGAAAGRYTQDFERVLRFTGTPRIDIYSGSGSSLGELSTPDEVSYPRFFAPGKDILYQTRDASDRIGHVSLSAPAGPYLGSETINTGFGDEFDSPYGFKLVPGTSLAVVIANESDQLAVIDAAAGAVIRRQSTARGPAAVEVRADLEILIGHSDGTLLALDALSGTESARLQLGAPIELVQPEPTGTRAWARVRSDATTSPALVLVETGGTAPGVLASIPLSGAAGLGVSPGPRAAAPRSVAFDFTSDLAYVASASGVIDVVDLQALQVIVTVPFPQMSNWTDVLLSPNGSQLFVRQVQDMVSALSTANGLSTQWTVGCTNLFDSPSSLSMTSDGSTLFIDTPRLSSSNPCPGLIAVDTATGLSNDSIASSNGMGSAAAGDDIVFGNSSTGGLSLTRFDGSSFGAQVDSFEPRQAISPPALDASTGRAGVLMGAAFVPGSDVDVFLAVDFFGGRVTIGCDNGTSNATGALTSLSVHRSPFAGNVIELRAAGLQPGSMFGALIVGNQLVPPMPAGSGVGQLCVGGASGFVTSQIQSASASGEHSFTLDTSSVATSIGVLAFQPGESWTFQDWHRDSTPQGQATSNTSNALQVQFY